MAWGDLINTTSGTTSPTTLTGVRPGSLIVLVLVAQGAISTGVITGSTTQDLVQAVPEAKSVDSATNTMKMFYIQAAQGGSCSVSWTAGTSPTMIMMQFDGAGAPCSLGWGASISAALPSNSIPRVVIPPMNMMDNIFDPLMESALVITACASDNAAPTPPTGYTTDVTVNPTDNFKTAHLRVFAPHGGSYQPLWTVGFTTGNGVILAAFRQVIPNVNRKTKYWMQPTGAVAGPIVKTWNGLAWSSVKTFNGLARASVKKLDGMQSQ